MPFIHCPNCNSLISEAAERCPSCKHKLKKEARRIIAIILICVVSLIIIATIVILIKNHINAINDNNVLNDNYNALNATYHSLKANYDDIFSQNTDLTKKITMLDDNVDYLKESNSKLTDDLSESQKRVTELTNELRDTMLKLATALEENVSDTIDILGYDIAIVLSNVFVEDSTYNGVEYKYKGIDYDNKTISLSLYCDQDGEFGLMMYQSNKKYVSYKSDWINTVNTTKDMSDMLMEQTKSSETGISIKIDLYSLIDKDLLSNYAQTKDLLRLSMTNGEITYNAMD